MHEHSTVSKIIRELHDELGGAILINDIMQRSSEEGISEEDVHNALEQLEQDGMVTRIDDDTIEFM